MGLDFLIDGIFVFFEGNCLLNYYFVVWFVEMFVGVVEDDFDIGWYDCRVWFFV